MDRFWRARAAGMLTCRLYHRVAERGRFPFMEDVGAPSISPDALKRELGFLRDQGARFMTFADLRRGEFPSEHEFGVIVSFDDGLRDNYEEGLMVLDALGIPGVIFQSSGLVDSDHLIWEHELYWVAANEEMSACLVQRAHALLPDAQALTGPALVHYLRERAPVDQVEAILDHVERQFGTAQAQMEIAERLYPTSEHLRRAQSGGHEIGSHGDRHYMRSSVSAEVFEDELLRSSERLGAILGRAPTAFSYPFNSFLPGDDEVCARYFEQAATVEGITVSRTGDPLRIPRQSWLGPSRNGLRERRWLWTGRI